MPDNAQIRGVEFEVTGNAAKAANSLDKLTNALGRMKNAVNGDGTGAAELKKLSDALGNLKADNLSGLSKAIKSIGASEGKIGLIADYLVGISKLDFSNLTDAATAMNAIAGAAKQTRSVGGGRSAASDASAETPVDAGTVESESEAVAAALDDASDAVERDNSAMLKLVSTVAKLGKAFAGAAVNVGKFALNLLAAPFKRAAESIKNLTQKALGLLSSFKRIVMYRAIRTVLKLITSSIKEGIENIYQYSSIVGTEFKRSMDTLATDALYVKNLLGSIAAPLVNMVAPIIDMITDKFADLANQVAQVMAALSGKSTYSKALKYTTEFADATGKAAKELQKFLLPFDEINRMSDNSGSSSSDELDYSRMFEESGVLSDIADFAKRIRDAIQRGEWDELGTLISDKINGFFDKVDWRGIGEKVGYAINGLISSAYATLSGTDFKKIGQSISKTINGTLSKIDFKKAGRLVVRKITALFDLLIGFIKGLDWRLVARSIGDFLTGAFLEVADWIRETDFVELGQNASQALVLILDALLEAAKTIPWHDIGVAIGDFLSGIDWETILGQVFDIIVTVVGGLMDGLFNTEGGRIAVVLFAGITGLKAVINNAGTILNTAVEAVVNGIGTKFEGLGQTLTSAGKNIGTAALGAFDAIMVAYDAKTISQAANDYEAVLPAVNGEVESNLKLFATIWEKQGEEAAKAWANTAYQIDLTGQGLDDSMAALAEKIRHQYDGVAKDLWEGFSLGWNDYFGENGAGLLSLMDDGFRMAVNGIKDMLGIHSPSTVFAGIGENMVQGLENGFKTKWDGFVAKLRGWWESIKGIFSGFSVSLPSVSVNTGGVRAYASGGFVDSGELFVANERGPEMVGTMNNRTAVANQQEIVDGIRAGVSDANEDVVSAVLSIGVQIVNAIQENGGGGITIDDLERAISTRQTNRARAMGY